jgi:uncharacterized protein
VAYGLNITPERLARIDAAEQVLRSLDLGTVRVRLHENELARLEVPLHALPQLCEVGVRDAVVERLKSLGFRYVTLDLEGFRSGSFQQLVPADQLVKFAQSAQQQYQGVESSPEFAIKKSHRRGLEAAAGRALRGGR